MVFLQQYSWIADWIVPIGLLLSTVYWLIRNYLKRRTQVKKLKRTIEDYYSLLERLDIPSNKNMNEFDRIKAENRSRYGTCENFLRQLEFQVDHECNNLRNNERVRIQSVLSNFKNSMESHRRTAIKMNAGYRQTEPSTLENPFFRTIDMRIATIETETDGLFPTEGIYRIYFKQFSELSFLNIQYDQTTDE